MARLYCIISNQCGWNLCCGADYHLLPRGHTKAAFDNKRMSQFVLTGDHIIIEATMILFTDGNNCRCPVINDIMPTKSHIQAILPVYKDQHDCKMFLETTTISRLWTNLNTQYRDRGGSRNISEEAVQCFLFTYII